MWMMVRQGCRSPSGGYAAPGAQFGGKIVCSRFVDSGVTMPIWGCPVAFPVQAGKEIWVREIRELQPVVAITQVHAVGQGKCFLENHTVSPVPATLLSWCSVSCGCFINIWWKWWKTDWLVGIHCFLISAPKKCQNVFVVGYRVYGVWLWVILSIVYV